MKKFTYGDQFSPDKFSLKEILKICKNFENDRKALQEHIATTYFSLSGTSANKMAMNTVLSLNSYGLIELYNSGKEYKLTDLGELLLVTENDEEAYESFVKHILTELEGLLLLKLIYGMQIRGEKITLESLAYRLHNMGFKIAPNSTYISTMKSWLNTMDIFETKRGYEIRWESVESILGLTNETIDDLYHLTYEQKHFMLSLLSLGSEEFLPSNKVAEHTRSVFRVNLTTKGLVKEIIDPLEELGLLESRKATTGRGAKPHLVKLSEKSNNELLVPILSNISEETGIELNLLNKSFDDVVNGLNVANTYEKGINLELLAIWITRFLSLKFRGWRVRGNQTGGAEVDVIAANDKLIYNRWQIQCKNTNIVIGNDIIAREVGLTFLTKADVILILTTSTFSPKAKFFADKVMSDSRYYIILLDGNDLNQIVDDHTSIIKILNEKAKRVFMFKEMVGTDDQ